MPLNTVIGLLPQERIHESYVMPIPPDTRPGSYDIWLDVWNPLAKERLKTVQ